MPEDRRSIPTASETERSRRTASESSGSPSRTTTVSTKTSVVCSAEAMLIRPGEPSDANEIADLVGECDQALTHLMPSWTPPSHESELAKATTSLTSEAHWVRVAEADNTLVAYVVW